MVEMFFAARFGAVAFLLAVLGATLPQVALSQNVLFGSTIPIPQSYSGITSCLAVDPVRRVVFMGSSSTFPVRLLVQSYNLTAVTATAVSDSLAPGSVASCVLDRTYSYLYIGTSIGEVLQIDAITLTVLTLLSLGSSSVVSAANLPVNMMGYDSLNHIGYFGISNPLTLVKIELASFPNIAQTYSGAAVGWIGSAGVPAFAVDPYQTALLFAVTTAEAPANFTFVALDTSDLSAPPLGLWSLPSTCTATSGVQVQTWATTAFIACYNGNDPISSYLYTVSYNSSAVTFITAQQINAVADVVMQPNYATDGFVLLSTPEPQVLHIALPYTNTSYAMLSTSVLSSPYVAEASELLVDFTAMRAFVPGMSAAATDRLVMYDATNFSAPPLDSAPLDLHNGFARPRAAAFDLSLERLWVCGDNYALELQLFSDGSVSYGRNLTLNGTCTAVVHTSNGTAQFYASYYGANASLPSAPTLVLHDTYQLYVVDIASFAIQITATVTSPILALAYNPIRNSVLAAVQLNASVLEYRYTDLVLFPSLPLPPPLVTNPIPIALTLLVDPAAGLLHIAACSASGGGVSSVYAVLNLLTRLPTTTPLVFNGSETCFYFGSILDPVTGNVFLASGDPPALYNDTIYRYQSLVLNGTVGTPSGASGSFVDPFGRQLAVATGVTPVQVLRICVESDPFSIAETFLIPDAVAVGPYFASAFDPISASGYFLGTDTLLGVQFVSSNCPGAVPYLPQPNTTGYLSTTSMSAASTLIVGRLFALLSLGCLWTLTTCIA